MARLSFLSRSSGEVEGLVMFRARANSRHICHRALWSAKATHPGRRASHSDASRIEDKRLPADELKKKRLLPLEVGGVEEVAVVVVVVVTLHATTTNSIDLTHKTLNAPKH